MKGDITLKVLEKIKEGVEATTDLITVFLEAGYGASHSRVDYLLEKRQNYRERNRARAEELRKIKKRCYHFLESLKRDGLVRGTAAEPKITTKGIFKIRELQTRRIGALPAPVYPKGTSDRFIIVIFDIPEEIRRKRAWLRAVLTNLGFEKVQQSVWMGKVKIPVALIRDLERFNLMEYVDIFEATKLGTLSKV